jgi:DNA-binding NtrC family response regulator
METAILVVDDEVDFLDSVVRMLRIEGYEDITSMSKSVEVPELVETKTFDVAFLDITMPDLDGLDLLKIIKEKSPQTECIMITANEGIPTVIKAVRLGAYDYLLKPIMPEQLNHSLDRALERRRLLQSLLLRTSRAVGRALHNPAAFEEIVTACPAMLRLLHEAELHATSNIPILVTGDTGVGKELLARAIHRSSRRAKGPFVAINMLALSPTLFESEFFGHAKGAFTGADRDKAGFLAQAKGGTLFLDEIGDLSMEIQGKLLRILQEGEFVPVGKTRPEKADVRFVAATNQDLDKLVQQRKFRKDLFYRLQFAHLLIPPLKERKGDIPLLAQGFIKGSTRPEAVLTEDGEAMLGLHDWPGNVRELKGLLEASANLAEAGKIGPDQLRLPVKLVRTKKKASLVDPDKIEPLADVEQRHILQTYDAMGNNKSQTAKVLGIGLQTLHRKLKTYDVK